MARTMTPRTLTSLIVLALVNACGQAPPEDQHLGALHKPLPARLTTTANGHVAEVALRQDGALLSLSVTSSPNSADAPLSMARRADMWRPLVEQVLARSPRHDYLLTVGEYPELSERLASAAACSGKWNLQTGAPVSGTAGATVATLLTAEHLYPELSTMTEGLGYRTSVSSVESVVLCSWKSITRAGGNACGRAIDGDARVPCGASIVFRMSAEK